MEGEKLTCKGAQTAVAPGLLMPYVLAAKVNVRTGDECQIDAHEKVTGCQVPQVERVLHIAARLVEITAQQHQQVAHHSNGGHDPNAAGKNKGSEARGRKVERQREKKRERRSKDKQSKLQLEQTIGNVEIMKNDK